MVGSAAARHAFVFTRNGQGERRLTPRAYRLLLTTHIATSVGWLGVAFAKLVLGVVAVSAGDPEVAIGLYPAMSALSVAFPPVAVGTVVTGVLLSLGTRWGLLEHYWVATKLTLTVAVIATSVRLAEGAVRNAAAWSARAGDASLGLAPEPAALIALSFAHLLMLGVATVLSTYKPWGKTWLGRRTGSVKSATLRLTRLG